MVGEIGLVGFLMVAIVLSFDWFRFAFFFFLLRQPDLLLLESEGPVDHLDDDQDDGLPADQPPQPVEQLPVQDVGLFPRGGEHPLQVNLEYKKVIFIVVFVKSLTHSCSKVS